MLHGLNLTLTLPLPLTLTLTLSLTLPLPLTLTRQPSVVALPGESPTSHKRGRGRKVSHKDA